MKVDILADGHPLDEVEGQVALAERQGYAAWLAPEVVHDPFLALAVGAVTSQRIALGTSIAVAFARNPMTVAYAARDLQGALGDRQLVLGLGSQIRPHVTRRFSQPWPDRPAAAMREFVQAIRAIWACWDGEGDLDVRGKHYTHTLMTPMFTPPMVSRVPALWVAAVGPGMTRITGEVADGLICHAFTTPAYLRRATLPALQEGIDRVDGRGRADLEISVPPFVVTGYDAEEVERRRAEAVRRIAFYGSTPAYRPVLAAHGWEDLGVRLHELSVEGRWADMAALIPHEVVDTFAVCAEPDGMGEALAERFGGLVDRISLPSALLRDDHAAMLHQRLASI